MSGVDLVRIETRTKGFQSGWLKNLDSSQGKRWYLVTCGAKCAIGPGCLNCPANVESKKNKKMRVKCLTDQLLTPLEWKTGYSVFVCPEGDLFHKDVPKKFIAQAFAVMETCSVHRFILVTKRAKRMESILTDPSFPLMVYEEGKLLLGSGYQDRGKFWGDNILIGVSVENQDYMHRVQVLPRLPKMMTKILFVAPMLSPVEIPQEVLPSLDWVLCNGERGSKWCKPRPCKLEWQIDLAGQCNSAGIPFFLLRKLHSSWVGKMGGKRHLEFPEILTT